MNTNEKKNVDQEVGRLRTHPLPLVSGDVVRTKSNKSEAVKTRINLLSKCKNRKKKPNNFPPVRNLYQPKTHFEQSQCFKVVQKETESSVSSSNKERKRQLNWREFSTDLLGCENSWEQIKSKETFSSDFTYRDVDFDDDVVFQVIEPVYEEKQPLVIEVMGRNHVIGYDYESENTFTCLGKFKPSFRTFSQNVHEMFLEKMQASDYKNEIVVSHGAHCVETILDDVQEKQRKIPVPSKRTIFFPNGFKNPVPTPRTSLMTQKSLGFEGTLPSPVLDFDLVPEEKIFKDVLSSFNQYDPLYLAVCQKKAQLVKAAEVKSDLTYAASTSHHFSDVEVVSIKPQKVEVDLKLGSYYQYESAYVGQYTYGGFDLSNPVYVYPKYTPSFHWNKFRNGKIERFTVSDFDEKKTTKFDKIVKGKVTIYEDMRPVKKNGVRKFSPVEKTVSYKIYTLNEEPLCKKCKGSGCIKCNLWGSPITVKPEKWFEALSPRDDSLSPKITALKVTLSKEDKVKEL